MALSPIHIVMLLEGSPLLRGGLFVGGWLLTSALAVIGLLQLGNGLLLDMTHASDHRTGLDLIGGGALIALGGRN
ncbi:GAP family protein [Synechococcus sp. MU1642]|uniref:GAP family protein n=1 Tax=Synechococcus sp. MU1642 TaxID=2508348 RepID=UPI00351D2F04